VTRRRTFVCESPGAPADPLGAWWWVHGRPPVTIRSVVSIWKNPRRWQVTCALDHDFIGGPFAPIHIMVEGAWRNALTAALEHLETHR
jgi:hypothetical protein